MAAVALLAATTAIAQPTFPDTLYEWPDPGRSLQRVDVVALAKEVEAIEAALGPGLANVFGTALGTLPLTKLEDNGIADLCLLSGGSGGPPHFSACPGGGSGDLTQTGDCVTGACFTPGGSGSQLTLFGTTSGSQVLRAAAAASGTITLPAEIGTVCTTGSVCSGYAATSHTHAGSAITSGTVAPTVGGLGVNVSAIAKGGLVAGVAPGGFGVLPPAGSNGLALVSDSGQATGLTWSAVGTGTVTGTGATARVPFWTSTSGISSNANFSWDNALQRLGLGTATPEARLSIVGGYQISSLSTSAGNLNVAAGGTSPDAAQVIWGDGAGWKLQFGTRSGTNFQPRITFVDTGRLGINVTAPTQALHVSGSVRIDSGGGNGVFRKPDDSGEALRLANGATRTFGDWQWWNTAGSQEVARLTGTGRFAMGTTSPSVLVDLNDPTPLVEMVETDVTNSAAQLGVDGRRFTVAVQHDDAGFQFPPGLQVHGSRSSYLNGAHPYVSADRVSVQRTDPPKHFWTERAWISGRTNAWPGTWGMVHEDNHGSGIVTYLGYADDLRYPRRDGMPRYWLAGSGRGPGDYRAPYILAVGEPQQAQLSIRTTGESGGGAGLGMQQPNYLNANERLTVSAPITCSASPRFVCNTDGGWNAGLTCLSAASATYVPWNGTTGGCGGGACTSFPNEGCGTIGTTDAWVPSKRYFAVYAFEDFDKGDLRDVDELMETRWSRPANECGRECMNVGTSALSSQAIIDMPASGNVKFKLTLPKVCWNDGQTEKLCPNTQTACTTDTDCAADGSSFCGDFRKDCTSDANCGGGVGTCASAPPSADRVRVYYSWVAEETTATNYSNQAPNKFMYLATAVPVTCTTHEQCAGGLAHSSDLCVANRCESVLVTRPAEFFEQEQPSYWNLQTPEYAAIYGPQLGNPVGAFWRMPNHTKAGFILKGNDGGLPFDLLWTDTARTRGLARIVGEGVASLGGALRFSVKKKTGTNDVSYSTTTAGAPGIIALEILGETLGATVRIAPGEPPLTSGNGGAVPATFQVIGQTGQTTSGSTGQTASAGSAVSITGGIGGAAITGSTAATGGAAAVTGGAGGGNFGSGTGAVGAVAQLIGGAGGASLTGTGGAGALAIVRGGAGGNGSTGGQGGGVLIEPGAPGTGGSPGYLDVTLKGPLRFQSMSGQSAVLAEWKNSAGTTGASMTDAGVLTATIRDKGGAGIDVRAHGAVCDGTTNDQPAIQAALTAADAGNERVLLPGDCAIASPLTIGGAVQLVGLGRYRSILRVLASFSGSQAITSAGGIHNLTLDLTAKGTLNGIVETGASAESFTGLSILYPAGTGTGVGILVAANTPAFELRDVQVMSPGIGINYDGNETASEFKLRDVTVDNAETYPIRVARTTSADIGALYLDNVRVGNPLARATMRGILLTSTQAATQMPVFATQLIADNIKAGPTLEVVNIHGLTLDNSWVTNGASAGSNHAAIKLTDVTGFHIENSRIFSASRGFDLNGAITSTSARGSSIAGVHGVYIDAGATLTNVSMSQIVWSVSTAISNDIPKLAGAAGAEPGFTNGLQVWTTTGGANTTLRLFNAEAGATSPYKAFRVNTTGSLELLSNASAVLASLTDTGRWQTKARGDLTTGTFTDGDTTPSVLSGNVFKTGNTGATVITAFDDPTNSQVLTIVVGDANTDFDCTGTTLRCDGGTDVTTLNADDTISFAWTGAAWYETGRRVN